MATSNHQYIIKVYTYDLDFYFDVCYHFGPVTSPDSLAGPFGALGAFASVYSSIGVVCEGNTDTISARQVSVILISGGATIFLGALDPQEPTWRRGWIEAMWWYSHVLGKISSDSV